MIPADAVDDLERYSYQFCVAPEDSLIRELPFDRRTMWQTSIG